MNFDALIHEPWLWGGHNRGLKTNSLHDMLIFKTKFNAFSSTLDRLWVPISYNFGAISRSEKNGKIEISYTDSSLTVKCA